MLRVMLTLTVNAADCNVNNINDVGNYNNHYNS